MSFLYLPFLFKFRYFLYIAPIPSKKNSRLNFRNKSGRVISIPNKDYSERERKNLVYLKNTFTANSINKDLPCSLELVLQFKDYKRRDVDNALSSVFDLLVKAKVIADDCWRLLPNVTIKSVKGDLDKAFVRIFQV